MKPSTSEEPDENGIDVSSNEQNHENVNCFRPLSSRSSGELNGELEEAMTPALKDHLLDGLSLNKMPNDDDQKNLFVPSSVSAAKICASVEQVKQKEN